MKSYHVKTFKKLTVQKDCISILTVESSSFKHENTGQILPVTANMVSRKHFTAFIFGPDYTLGVNVPRDRANILIVLPPLQAVGTVLVLFTSDLS